MQVLYKTFILSKYIHISSNQDKINFHPVLTLNPKCTRLKNDMWQVKSIFCMSLITLQLIMVLLFV
jgi:hypothetical protein